MELSRDNYAFHCQVVWYGRREEFEDAIDKLLIWSVEDFTVSLTMMIVEIVHDCRQFCDILNRQFDLNLENDLDMMAAHLVIANLMLKRRLTKRNISKII